MTRASLLALLVGTLGALATLKLIGAPNWVIGRMILAQSLLLTLPGCGLGYLLTSVGVGCFPRTRSVSSARAG